MPSEKFIAYNILIIFLQKLKMHYHSLDQTPFKVSDTVHIQSRLSEYFLIRSLPNITEQI